MALEHSSGCVNHPGVDASARCKQCHKPICNTCKVDSAVGIFCSQGCQQKYEGFVQRVAQHEGMRKPGTLGTKIKGLIGKLIVILILLVALGVLGKLVEVPVLSPIVDKVLAAIGFPG
jgi:hypothetical protein